MLGLRIFQRHWSLLSRRFDIADNLGFSRVCICLDIAHNLGPPVPKMAYTLEDRRLNVKSKLDSYVTFQNSDATIVLLERIRVYFIGSKFHGGVPAHEKG